LHWELVIYQKRLDQGRFEIPKLEANKNQLSWPELVVLIEGIEILSIKRKARFVLQDTSKIVTFLGIKLLLFS